MRLNFIHGVAGCLALLSLLFMVACGSQDGPLPDETDKDAALFIRIATLDQTASRAQTQTLPDNEKMRGVRVVVLHPDGTVEHNQPYNVNGPREETCIYIKVTPDEDKKIFVFANEESVSEVEGVTFSGENRSLTSFFENYPKGRPGFEDAVEKLYFAPDCPGYSAGKAIPMSSEAKTVKVNRNGIVNVDLHVVRVATKFTVNFSNVRGDNVTVNSFSIKSHADRNYLMAHVNSWPGADLYPTWTEWLKTVSDNSSGNDDSSVTGAAGWLTDYELPPHNNVVYNHLQAITIPAATFDVNNLDNITPGTASMSFYLPESQNLTTGGEQEYILTLDIAGRSETFVCRLPNLKALFRNTHVVVNVTMDKDLEMSVDVIPFTSISVRPDYGLPREEFTGYIIGRDKEGNKCWYDGNYYDPDKAVPLYLGPKESPGQFVTINGKEYLLVYADIRDEATGNVTDPGADRGASNLNHFFEKETHKKYLLTPEGITGYTIMMDFQGYPMYVNREQQRVHLNSVWWPGPGKDNPQECPGTLNEWDRLVYAKANDWGWDIVTYGLYPTFWWDILGNRHTWSEGNTVEKRKAIIGEWIKYLE